MPLVLWAEAIRYVSISDISDFAFSGTDGLSIKINIEITQQLEK